MKTDHKCKTKCWGDGYTQMAVHVRRKSKPWGDGYALTLLVARGYASTDPCSCAALVSHNAGGLIIDCGCPRFPFNKGQQHSPELQMVDERLSPGTVPALTKNF
jgi:hypothetical protein